MTGPKKQGKLSPAPDTLPLFPLTGALLLPGGQLPLNIFEPRYLAMIDAALAGDRLIGMIQPMEESDLGRPQLYGAGCAGRITSFSETGDGRYLINLTGTQRFALAEELSTDTPYRLARPDWDAFSIDAQEDPSLADIDREELLETLQDYLAVENLHIEWEKAAEAPVEALIVSLAMGCPFQPNEKQAILEAKTHAEQAECLMALMELSGGDDGSAPVQ